MQSLIVVNLWAELPHEAAASAFESTVQGRLAGFGTTKQSQTARSLKRPHLFDLFFVLQPTMQPMSAFEGMLSTLGEGWERRDISDQEASASWNDRDGIRFFSPDVQLASVDCFAHSDLRNVRVACRSLADLSRSFGRVCRSLPPEMREQLGDIMKRYFARHGFEGAYERLKNRTALTIFAEYQPTPIKPVCSGEVDGVRYELFESP